MEEILDYYYSVDLIIRLQLEISKCLLDGEKCKVCYYWIKVYMFFF